VVKITTAKGHSIVADEHKIAASMTELLDDMSSRINKMWLYARLMAGMAFLTGVVVGLLLAKYL